MDRRIESHHHRILPRPLPAWKSVLMIESRRPRGDAPPVPMTERDHERELMLRAIAGSGVIDARIRAAFRSVPREAFVPPDRADSAYEDRALPIGEDQTISQPSMVALMLDALRPKAHERALEVGAGSGYAAAILSGLVREVDAIEIRPALAERARSTLEALHIDNVHVHVGNGERGLPDRAPYDVILVSAGARATPRALVEQLSVGGRIAIPVGERRGQRLLVGRRDHAGVSWERRVHCVFVPLVSHAQSA
jgi:protein-L-isoaspartate(D-aspartate) O-methyltransferase